jgi:HemY protein
MIRYLSFLAVAGVIALGLEWISSLRGAFVLALDDYSFTSSARSAGELILVFCAIGALVTQTLCLLLVALPGLGSWRNARQQRRGYEALSRGFIAAAAGEAYFANLHAQNAKALLGPYSLCLLLSAEIAGLTGDDAAQEQAWHAMLATTETAILGLRGLFVQAVQRGEPKIAEDLATRAHALDPNACWALDALFDLRLRQRRWTDARGILTQMCRANLLDTNSARRRESALLTGEAFQAEQCGNLDAALSGARSALLFSPGYSPAAMLAARILMRWGWEWSAQDVLATAWTHNPNPLVAQAYLSTRPTESKEVHAQRLSGLAHLNRDHLEGRMLLAEHAIICSDGTVRRPAVYWRPMPAAARARGCARCWLRSNGLKREARRRLMHARTLPRYPAPSMNGRMNAVVLPLPNGRPNAQIAPRSTRFPGRQRQLTSAKALWNCPRCGRLSIL